MKILVITDVLWRNDNGVGNSYSNIFSGMTDVEIANICCQEGRSENTVSAACFQISESRLIANLRNKSVPAGVVENPDVTTQAPGAHSSKLVRFLKRNRFQVLFWARNLIWKLGRWKSDELRAFLDRTQPELIFAQLQDKVYLNNIVRYVQDYTQCPLVLYAWDDIYSIKQFSLSPLFWIDRLMQRASIRRLVRHCSKLYTISVEQQEEYRRTLKADTGLLFKGKDFSQPLDREQEPGEVLQILYTGNLYSGRFGTLEKLCRALHGNNQSGLKAQLNIYSGTDLTDRQIAKLNLGDSSFFKGSVSEAEVCRLQEEADILLHIEPTTLKGRLLCRLSFSTKLVDYFHKGKCIFAVGSNVCASMKYLRRNDAAITAVAMPEAEEKLRQLLQDRDLLRQYGKKAWNCGAKHHQIHKIQQTLREELEKIVSR